MDIELIIAAIENTVDEAFDSYEYDDEMDGCDFHLGASGAMVDDERPEAWVGEIVDTLSNGLRDLQKGQRIVIGAISVNIDADSCELSIEVPVTCVKLH